MLVYVFLGLNRHHKLSGLNNRGLFSSVIDLETRSQKSRCEQGCACRTVLERDLFEASPTFWKSLSLWQHAPESSLSVYVHISPFCDDTSHARLRAHPTLLRLLFHFICSNPVANAGPFWVTGVPDFSLWISREATQPITMPHRWRFWGSGWGLGSLAALQSTESPLRTRVSGICWFQVTGPSRACDVISHSLWAIYGLQACEHLNACVQKRQSARQASTPT